DHLGQLRVDQQSLNQRLARAAAVQAAHEGEITRLTAKPVIDQQQALEGLARFLGHCPTPAQAQAKLDAWNARRRATLAIALALEQDERAMQSLAALSEAQVGLLFHLGFSEYHLLSMLTGNANQFVYQLK